MTRKEKIQRLVKELTGILKAEARVRFADEAERLAWIEKTPELKSAIDWLKTGCRYSNHDFDVEMRLQCVIESFLIHW